ncbi:HAD family hydrolase [Streptomyces erythrochromogenes]|uniref:HAD family hydrolase n=1 Tax=Streptomyces erythrochromogenes TaxID=285574 RepID=UPI003820F63B
MVMDKTGTLTKGEPEVTEVITAPGRDRQEVLRLVAAVEGESEHPLAEAVVRHAEAHAVGNRRPAERGGVYLGPLAARRDETPLRPSVGHGCPGGAGRCAG